MPSCVVCGSMRRHLEEMKVTAAALEATGFTVLSPRSFEARSESEGFVYVSGDKGSKEEIQRRHLEAIDEADFVYLVCPAGYVGLSAAVEVGYAIRARVPVYASEQPEDAVLVPLVKVRPPSAL